LTDEATEAVWEDVLQDTAGGQVCRGRTCTRRTCGGDVFTTVDSAQVCSGILVTAATGHVGGVDLMTEVSRQTWGGTLVTGTAGRPAGVTQVTEASGTWTGGGLVAVDTGQIFTMVTTGVGHGGG
jgi:hypothetical protein